MNNILNIYKNLYENDKNNADIQELTDIKLSTLYKYIAIFKKAGFTIIKRKGEYKLASYSNSVKLSDAEEGLIAYLLLLSNMLLSKRKNKVFSDLISKMLKFTNKNTENEVYKKSERMKKSVNTDIYSEKIELFEKYKNEGFEIAVILKNGKKLELLPKRILYGEKKIYFCFINKNRETEQIDINKIVKLTPKKKKLRLNDNSEEIIFELYGRLSKNYLLKEGERMVCGTSNKLIVANSCSDKEKLFRRLLRYDTLCKVKFPKKNMLDFKKIIEKSLENIESIKDNIYNEVKS